MLRKIKFKTLIIFFSFFLFLLPTLAKENDINISIIHSNTCSHCKESLKFFKKIENNYKNITINKYEIGINKDKVKEIEDNYNIKIISVPTIIINDTIYTGFDEKSKEKILKTIDYYKRTRKISLKEYLKRTNYQLVGNIYTSDIDNNSIYPILGILSIFNINNIIISIILVILLIKENNSKNQILLLFNYILVLSLLTINNIIYNNNNLLSILIFIIPIALIIINIIKYLKDKRITNINNIIVIFLAIINKVIELLLLNKNITILNNISKYEIELLNKIINYSNYLVSYTLLNLLLIITLTKINKNLTCC